VFVSGCYDILHGGHLEFWSQARALGTHLTVSFASDDVLAAHKSSRRSSIPTEHKKQLIGVWVSALQLNCATYPCPRIVQPWLVRTLFHETCHHTLQLVSTFTQLSVCGHCARAKFKGQCAPSDASRGYWEGEGRGEQFCDYWCSRDSEGGPWGQFLPMRSSCTCKLFD